MSGFDFWLQKTDSLRLAGEGELSESGAFERIKCAEMFKAFILTDECRRRFGR